MKLIHISDLHLGKRLKERSLMEDQKIVLEQILDMVRAEGPDGVIIAGDVYDKAVPPIEAVLLLDDFMVGLSELCNHIFLIGGNHDSVERISFGGRLMEGSGVHVAPHFAGCMEKFSLEDEHGRVNFWMLPFIKPLQVRDLDENIDREDYSRAVELVIGRSMSKEDEQDRNVLIAHQYVAGSLRSESEEVVIGGLDEVDPTVFDAFDYVALGHLHRAQQAGGENIRYSGAPLKYSFSEAEDEKCALLIELGAKEEDKVSLEVKALPLHQPRDLRTVSGSFDELMSRGHRESQREREAFIKAELSDEEFIPDGIQRLRTVYPNILELRYPNASKGDGEILEPEERETEEKKPLEYLEEFFRAMRGREMSQEQQRFAEEAVRRIWEEEA